MKASVATTETLVSQRSATCRLQPTLKLRSRLKLVQAERKIKFPQKLKFPQAPYPFKATKPIRPSRYAYAYSLKTLWIIASGERHPIALFFIAKRITIKQTNQADSSTLSPLDLVYCQYVLIKLLIINHNFATIDYIHTLLQLTQVIHLNLTTTEIVDGCRLRVKNGHMD